MKQTFKTLQLILVFQLLILSISAQQAGFFLDEWSPKVGEELPYEVLSKPQGDANVTVQIDMHDTTEKVSKYLFGTNAVMYGGDILEDESVKENLGNLSPHVLRWPGGNRSHQYFWNHAPDSPPTDVNMTNFETGGTFDIHYGKTELAWEITLDEFYDYLAEMDMEAIMCVNTGYARYGTSEDPVAKAAQMAADWVRYDNGRTTYWELGNEDFGQWEAGYQIDQSTNQDGQPEVVSGQLYGKHCKVFMDSMRAAAAEIGHEIKLGVVTWETETSYNPVQTDWNEGMMPEVGHLADFLIIHNYYTPYQEDSPFSTILNSAAHTQEMKEAVEADMAEAGKDMLPITLTEYNIFAEGSMQGVSNVNGMHATLVIGEMMKNGFGLANRWNMINGWGNGNDHGTFASDDAPGVDKYDPYPAFYYLYYFQKMFGDTYIESSVTGSSTVKAYASKYTSGEGAVVLVNMSKTTQIVDVQLDNFTPGENYYYYTLSGDDDNGDFSRKVIVNGEEPSGEGGGPANYHSLSANASAISGGVKVELPALGVVFLRVDEVPPLTYDFARIDGDANTIELELSHEITLNEPVSGFEVHINEITDNPVDSIKLHGTKSNVLLIYVQDEILNTDTISLSYTEGNVVSTENVPLVEFADAFVDNLLPGSAPRLVLATTTTDGTTLSLTFNKDMQLNSVVPSDFEIRTILDSDEAMIPVSAVDVNAEDLKQVILTPEEQIFGEFRVLISYAGTELGSVDAGVVFPFDDFDATNISPGFPPELLSAEASDGGFAVTLTFDKTLNEIANGESLFTLERGVDELNIVSLSAEGKQLKLNINTAIFNGDEVMVSYDGTAITAIDRGLLMPFADSSVQNDLPQYEVMTIPGVVDCELFIVNNGMQLEDSEDEGAGQNLGYIEPGDYLDFLVNVTDAGLFTVGVRSASQTTGGRLMVQTPDNETAELGSINTPPTGGWQNWYTSYGTVEMQTGVQRLRLYAQSSGFNLNWVQFAAGNTMEVVKATTAYTSTDGSTISVEFEKDIYAPESDQLNNFGLIYEGENISIQKLERSTSAVNTLVLTPTVVADPSLHSIQVSYTPGELVALDNNALDAFDLSVENQVSIINAPTLQNIGVYPNPANDYLVLTGLPTGQYGVEVYTLLGELVLSDQITSDNSSIDISGLSNGMYLLYFEEYSNVLKLIKE